MSLPRPIPQPDADDEAWWDSLKQGRLTAPWCAVCEKSWLRATPSCPHCGSTDWGYRDVSRLGSVYTWVTIHRALDPSFAAEVPYTIVVVELDGGARLNARLLGAVDGLTAGARVELGFSPGLDGWPTLEAEVEAGDADRNEPTAIASK